MDKSTNPFETYAQTFADILRKRHICPTIWKYDPEDIRSDGEAELNAKKYEYWVNDACAEGHCEYCYGARYNEWFEEKPTEDEIGLHLVKHQIKCDMAKKVKRKTYNELLVKNSGETAQLITLCIDKEYKQIPKVAELILGVISQTNYSFLVDAVGTIEVYGEDSNWNPHIHIITRKVKRCGQVAQVLRRKFQTPKYQVYRIDVKELPYNSGLEYVMGEKQKKQMETSHPTPKRSMRHSVRWRR